MMCAPRLQSNENDVPFPGSMKDTSNVKHDGCECDTTVTMQDSVGDSLGDHSDDDDDMKEQHQEELDQNKKRFLSMMQNQFQRIPSNRFLVERVVETEIINQRLVEENEELVEDMGALIDENEELHKLIHSLKEKICILEDSNREANEALRAASLARHSSLATKKSPKTRHERISSMFTTRTEEEKALVRKDQGGIQISFSKSQGNTSGGNDRRADGVDSPLSRFSKKITQCSSPDTLTLPCKPGSNNNIKMASIREERNSQVYGSENNLFGLVRPSNTINRSLDTYRDNGRSEACGAEPSSTGNAQSRFFPSKSVESIRSFFWTTTEGTNKPSSSGYSIADETGPSAAKNAQWYISASFKRHASPAEE